MKKIISLLICLILLIGITSCAYASPFNPNNGQTIFIPSTNNTMTYGPVIVYPDGSRIIFSPPSMIVEEEETINYNNQSSSNEDVSLPDDTTQAVDYQIDKEETIQKIFELTNKARQENNLPALTYNKDIQDAADLRAKEISTKFSHTRPDGSNCHTVVEKFEYRVTGENLIMADNPISEPEILLDTWMNSEGHRANILLPDFTSIAIGLYEKDDVTYAVQIFMG